MKVIESSEDNYMQNDTAIAIGNFDGVHLGHRVLIERLVDEACKNGLDSIVYTFKTNTHSENKILCSNEERDKLISNQNVDYIYVQDFTETFSNLKANEFVEDVLIKKFRAKKVIVGFNFRFGKNASGDISVLKELLSKNSCELIIIDKVVIDNNVVSSTLIRNLINQSRFSEVPKYLGRNYSIKGNVIRGRQVGRQIGFPTANISINPEQLIPTNGVYCTKTYIDNICYPSMTNIGFNPTFNLKNISIETHILNFNEDIYGKNIEVEFLEKTRPEMKFSTVDELVNQMNKDKKYVNNKIKDI